MLALPGADDRLKVLIATDNNTGKRNVHRDGERIRAVETTQALLPHDVREALVHREVLAQLETLLHHVCRCDEEIMSESGRASNQQCFGEVELFIVDVEKDFQVLIGKKIARMGRHTPTCHDLGALPEAEETFILVEYSSHVSHTKALSTGLNVRFDRVYRKNTNMFHDAGT